MDRRERIDKRRDETRDGSRERGTRREKIKQTNIPSATFGNVLSSKKLNTCNSSSEGNTESACACVRELMELLRNSASLLVMLLLLTLMLLSSIDLSEETS